MRQAKNNTWIALWIVVGLCLLASFFYPFGRCRIEGYQYDSLAFQDVADLDPSLLTGEPCMPPCWQGLTPDESGIDQVLTTLGRLEFVESSSIDQRPDRVIWGTTPTDASFIAGEILLRDDHVDRIELEVGYLLELQELIDVYGEPLGYLVWEFLPFEAEPCYRYWLEVVWPEYGLTAEIHIVRKQAIQPGELLEPSQPAKILVQNDYPSYLLVELVSINQGGHDLTAFFPVQRVVYTPSSDSMEDYLATRHFRIDEVKDLLENNYQAWLGIERVVMPERQQ